MKVYVVNYLEIYHGKIITHAYPYTSYGEALAGLQAQYRYDKESMSEYEEVVDRPEKDENGAVIGYEVYGKGCRMDNMCKASIQEVI